MYRSLESHLRTPGIDLISLVPGLICFVARPGHFGAKTFGLFGLRLTPDSLRSRRRKG